MTTYIALIIGSGLGKWFIYLVLLYLKFFAHSTHQNIQLVVSPPVPVHTSSSASPPCNSLSGLNNNYGILTICMSPGLNILSKFIA